MATAVLVPLMCIGLVALMIYFGRRWRDKLQREARALLGGADIEMLSPVSSSETDAEGMPLVLVTRCEGGAFEQDLAMGNATIV